MSDEMITKVGSMRQAVRELAALGHAGMIKPVADLLTAVDAVDAHAAGLLTEAREARDRLVVGLSTGKAEPADLLLFAGLAMPANSSGELRASPALNVVKSHAKAALHRNAYAVGMGIAPQMFAALAERAAVVVKSVAAAKLPADAWTELDALRAKPADYRKVVDGTDELTRLHRAYAALRRVGWLPELREARGQWLSYVDPWPRPVQVNLFQHAVYTAGDLIATMATGVGTEAIPAPLALWHACRVGAQPGLYAVDDAEKRYAAWLRKASSATAGPRR